MWMNLKNVINGGIADNESGRRKKPNHQFFPFRNHFFGINPYVGYGVIEFYGETC